MPLHWINYETIRAYITKKMIFYLKERDFSSMEILENVWNRNMVVSTIKICMSKVGA